MKKLFSILLLISIVLAAFSSVGVLAAKNDESEVQIASFAANGSFENITADGKPDKWNISSVTKMDEHVQISDKAKDGEKSIYMQGETGASSGKMVSQLISGLMPGSKYKVTFYARIDAVTGVKTGTVDIYFRDSAGATIKYDGGNGERIGFTSIDKKWHKYEHEMIAPERTVGAQLCVRMYDGTVGYVDNIEFTGEVAPQICKVLDPLPGEENMLKNSSLEEIGDDGKPVNWKINAVDKVKVVDDPQQGKVLRYESADASHPWASQEISGDFEVGATYQVSAMLKTEYVPSLGTNKGPSFKLEFYDATRTPMY
ncbi:MAG: carbohydrate binding domain-containing protein, partial [Clostridia bacterium]|nr:carbohydrate binding domain-containing protein [Clostridia bacterium]